MAIPWKPATASPPADAWNRKKDAAAAAPLATAGTVAAAGMPTTAMTPATAGANSIAPPTEKGMPEVAGSSALAWKLIYDERIPNNAKIQVPVRGNEADNYSAPTE